MKKVSKKRILEMTNKISEDEQFCASVHEYREAIRWWANRDHEARQELAQIKGSIEMYFSMLKNLR